MFDRSKEFEIKILSGGEKSCVVAFPTDAQWAERTRKQKAVRRFLGRGKSTYEVPDAEGADAWLFAQIRRDGDGAPFDAAEAARVIERLERCRVLEAERDGDTFRITFAVPGARVVHVLRIPVQADIMRFGKTSVRSVDGRRERNITVSLEPSAELWAKVLVSVEGYADPMAVPIVHKDVAVIEILAQVEAVADPGDEDEGEF